MQQQNVHMTSNKTTTASIQTLLDELRQNMQAHYGERLAELVVFGSQARGDAVPGSDVDVLVVLHEAQKPADRAFCRELAYTLLLRYDILVSLLHTTIDQYLREQSPLFLNVRREGIALTNGTKHWQYGVLHYSEDMIHDMKPEQKALLQKAEESLRAAKLMNNEAMYGFAVSRAYYAMFYVAQALLLSKGLAFSKHSAVIAAFGKHIALPGVVPLAYHRYLIDAQDARIVGDYAADAKLTEADATTCIAHAEAFVEAAHRVL